MDAKIESFKKVFEGLNDGGMINNPAYNMQIVGRTFSAETADWTSETAAEYRRYAMARMVTQVKAAR